MSIPWRWVGRCSAALTRPSNRGWAWPPARSRRSWLPAGPGPEYIYATQGEIDYQNAIIGTEQTVEGMDHALPPDTAVQKRNPAGGMATFLSFFVVDPDEPFAPEASFE